VSDLAITPSAHRLDVVVLTSAVLGIELAAALAGLNEVRSLTVVTTNVMRGRRNFREKLKGIYRHDGPAGVLRAGIRRIYRKDAGQDLAAAVAARCPGIKHLHCADLHAPESLALLKDLNPDLGVVFAAYRLEPTVFTIPRLGCLNLHLGEAPEFRGSSPAFYEMLEGVPCVGVTVHRVTEGLDAGPILKQESFPIDLAPQGDPIAYLQSYQSQVLVPNGIRLMSEAVRLCALGQISEWPQGPAGRPTRRRATYQLKLELRRIVAGRRARRVATLNPV
jgi:folate-dependent phosphoribosylglycinamide formyltransferase PurN